MSKSFGAIRALDRLSVEIPTHSIFALLGPNGAGKTTLLRLLAGVLPLDGDSSGSITMDNVASTRWAEGTCAIVPENAPAPADMRVESYLASQARLCSVAESEVSDNVTRSMDACRLGEVRTRLIGVLSRGFRQRVALAAAMVGRPKILILDEPTSGLDPGQLAVFRSLLSTMRDDCTVVLSSHHLPEVEACATHALIMNHGRGVWSGTIEELRTRAATINDAYALLLASDGVMS